MMDRASKESADMPMIGRRFEKNNFRGMEKGCAAKGGDNGEAPCRTGCGPNAGVSRKNVLKEEPVHACLAN